jgi:hypothetical protein
MPEPIDYRVLRNLQAALGQMTVAGGYHYDVAVGAVKLDPDHDVEALIAPGGPRPFIIFAVGDERWEYQPAMRLALVLPVTLYWLQDSDPTDDESLLKTYFRGCADIEQALALDVTRGGLAVDTRIKQRRLDRVVDGTQVWALIDLEIKIHRGYGRANG